MQNSAPTVPDMTARPKHSADDDKGTEDAAAAGTGDLEFTVFALEHSMEVPTPEWGDPEFSAHFSRAVKRVPVLHFFGYTPDRRTVCAHLHGHLPYLYVPVFNTRLSALDFGAQLELAAVRHLGLDASARVLHGVEVVQGVPFYGFFTTPRLFYRITAYAPFMMSRLANLLGSTTFVCGRRWQPHEGHVPYHFQAMVDLGVSGMSLVTATRGVLRHGSKSAGLDPSRFPETPASKASPADLEVDVDVRHFQPRRLGPGDQLATLRTTLEGYLATLGKGPDVLERAVATDGLERWPVPKVQAVDPLVPVMRRRAEEIEAQHRVQPSATDTQDDLDADAADRKHDVKNADRKDAIDDKKGGGAAAAAAAARRRALLSTSTTEPCVGGTPPDTPLLHNAPPAGRVDYSDEAKKRKGAAAEALPAALVQAHRQLNATRANPDADERSPGPVADELSDEDRAALMMPTCDLLAALDAGDDDRDEAEANPMDSLLHGDGDALGDDGDDAGCSGLLGTQMPTDTDGGAEAMHKLLDAQERRASTSLLRRRSSGGPPRKSTSALALLGGGDRLVIPTRRKSAGGAPAQQAAVPAVQPGKPIDDRNVAATDDESDETPAPAAQPGVMEPVVLTFADAALQRAATQFALPSQQLLLSSVSASPIQRQATVVGEEVVLFDDADDEQSSVCSDGDASDTATAAPPTRQPSRPASELSLFPPSVSPAKTTEPSSAPDIAVDVAHSGDDVAVAAAGHVAARPLSRSSSGGDSVRVVGETPPLHTTSPARSVLAKRSALSRRGDAHAPAIRRPACTEDAIVVGDSVDLLSPVHPRGEAVIRRFTPELAPPAMLPSQSPRAVVNAGPSSAVKPLTHPARTTSTAYRIRAPSSAPAAAAVSESPALQGASNIASRPAEADRSDGDAGWTAEAVAELLQAVNALKGRRALPPLLTARLGHMTQLAELVTNPSHQYIKRSVDPGSAARKAKKDTGAARVRGRTAGIAYLRVLGIETTSRPAPKRVAGAGDPIELITLAESTSALHEWSMVVLTTLPRFSITAPARVELVHVPNEPDLLRRAVDEIVRRDPDILLSWNVQRGGVSSLLERYRRVLYKDPGAIISRLGALDVPSAAPPVGGDDGSSDGDDDAELPNAAGDEESRAARFAPKPRPLPRRGRDDDDGGGDVPRRAPGLAEVLGLADPAAALRAMEAGGKPASLGPGSGGRPGAQGDEAVSAFGNRSDAPSGDGARSAAMPLARQKIVIAGRVVLGLWRVVRSEVKQKSYTINAMAEGLLGETFAEFSDWNLSELLHSPNSGLDRDVGIKHVVRRAELVMRIARHLDVFVRTSEMAQIYGILFLEVLSRGSQFRVEATLHRFAKPLGYVLVSPSREQVMMQNKQEGIALVMEPYSAFYTDPVVVLDFRSLYPSIVIAYNLCYTTCMGKVNAARVKKVGTLSGYRQPPGYTGKCAFAPNSAQFVYDDVRKGTLPMMLDAILRSRFMVQACMKQAAAAGDDERRRVFDAQQTGLKLLANVTYGYAAATFTGRMPCSDISDSIVLLGRQTLERAIRVVEGTPRFRARVVYGDTDSIFVQLQGTPRSEAFAVAKEMVAAVNAQNPQPVQIKFEKVYHPCFMVVKKRYVGYAWETPEQTVPKFDAKGIESIRRDQCPATSKLQVALLRTMFDSKDVRAVRRHFVAEVSRLMRNDVVPTDVILRSEVKLGTYARDSTLPPAARVALRQMATDPGTAPAHGERVAYIVTNQTNALLKDMVRHPTVLLEDGPAADPPTINAEHYVLKHIVPSMNRIFHLVGADVGVWFQHMARLRPRRKLFSHALVTWSPLNPTGGGGGEASPPMPHATTTSASGNHQGNLRDQGIARFYQHAECITCKIGKACTPPHEPPFCATCLSESGRPGAYRKALLHMRCAARDAEQLIDTCTRCVATSNPAATALCRNVDCAVVFQRHDAQVMLRQWETAVQYLALKPVLSAHESRQAEQQRASRNDSIANGGATVARPRVPTGNSAADAVVLD